jgi:hypothetical protein
MRRAAGPPRWPVAGQPSDFVNEEAVMAEQRKMSDTVPEKFGELIEGFRELLAKYPDAARYFSLAYHPSGTADDDGAVLGETTTAGITQPVFECSEIEPGLMVCERVDLM